MHFLSRSFLYGTGFAVALSLAAPAQADLVKCHKTVVNQLVRFKKKHLSLHIRCIDKQNVGKITGPCPDTVSVDKLDTLAARIDTKIATDCTMGELTTLGFASDCELEPATTGIEGDCADLPVSNPTELSQCLRCWKGAELSEFIATLYASHSLEVCGGDLSESSPVCSDLDCTTPLPDQRDLGDTGENDCQRAVAKAGFKYLVNREKTLEKCGLAGGTQATCLADSVVQEKLQIAADKRDTLIQNKCGNRGPAASVPFCCRTMGNMCMAAATREDCETGGGTVQENKFCDVDNTCANPPGGQKLTWWEFCPESPSCPGTPLSTNDDIKTCVGTAAEAIVDELLCWQFPGNGGADWPCPPPDGSASGAFVDGLQLFF